MRAKDCAIDMWDGGYLYKEFIFEFPIYYSNGTESRFITKIAFHSNTLVFIFFVGIVSGEKAFQYESYGMKDLIIL